jgi:hypothetical protein
MNPKPGRRCVTVVLAFVLLLALVVGVPQAGAVSGATYTSVCDGSKVNANLYADRRDVYLNGGPQPPACSEAAGLSPDGDYYFQVTDPSGATLLSTDRLACRVVTVKDGVITGYKPAGSCPFGATDGCPGPSDGPHNLGTGPCGDDAVSVQLWPFDETPNPGGVYKAWLMPVDALPSECDATEIDPGNCGGSKHGFVDADSKTDNFRVKAAPPEQGEIDVFKFCDANANGILDPAELLLGLQGWHIDVINTSSCSGDTDANGLLSCGSLEAATYDVAETVQSGFKHTATCVDGDCGTGACSVTTATSCTTDADCPSGETCIVPPPGSASTSIVVTGGDTHHVDFGNVGLSTISGRKFDDRNANGVDNSEPGIAGVKILLTGTAANGAAVSLCTVTDSSGNYSFPDLLPGTYTVSEVKPTGTIATTPTSCDREITLLEDGTCAASTPETCGFGNACLGAGGGRTLGFWTNKNGQALITSADLTFLVGLNLRTLDGGNFDPATKTQLKNWLLAAKATNMAYMLSAQLATMELNVRHGFVNGAALVFAGPDPNNCLSDVNGFISVNDLMAAADTELGADGNTPAGDPNRVCQEYKKNALDAANNNQNFEVACPSDFHATCPSP